MLNIPFPPVRQNMLQLNIEIAINSRGKIITKHTPYPKTGILYPEANGNFESILKSLMVIDAKPRLLDKEKICKFVISNFDANLRMFVLCSLNLVLRSMYRCGLLIFKGVCRSERN